MVSTVDLWLDVLVRAAGTTHVVVDEDDFAEACTNQWLSEREARGAEAGLSDLLRLIEQDGLFALLNAVCPFGPSDPLPGRPMVRLDVANYPTLQSGHRWSW